MTDRFQNWKKPALQHNQLTEWNWVVQHPENLEIGNRVDVGAFTYINAKHGVKLGELVEIGSHCSIYSISTIDHKTGKVDIGASSCIGSHSTVMPGVKIGKNVTIGAHSFVNKDLPDNCIAYGVPVKIIKFKE
jgi:acetyltransferase-like isoleucine patch superfamily enzyme